MRLPDSWRKATALTAGLLLLLVGAWTHVDREVLALMAGLVATYIGAQGVADHGKSRALIESRKPPVE